MSESFADLMNKEESLHFELQPYLEEPENSFAMLRHPLVFGVPYTPHMNAVYNAQLRQKKEMLQKAEEKKAWGSWVFIHERPYRFQALDEIKDKIESDKEYWNILGEVWSDSENIWQVEDTAICLLESERSEPKHLMNEEEYNFLQSLPDEIAIYRGHQKVNRDGYSWTLCPWRAKWFAQRYQQVAEPVAVTRGYVPTEWVYAYLGGRGEMEIVVNPELVNHKEDLRKHPRFDEDEAWLVEWWHKLQCDYKLGARSFHGSWHWHNVHDKAVQLAEATPGADIKVVKAFAVFHDSQRENEDEDPEHGKRAANFIRDYRSRIELDDKQLECLMYACEHHTGGINSNDPTIGVCWDADRLDLPRVGIIPDTKYLSTDAAKKNMWRL